MSCCRRAQISSKRKSQPSGMKRISEGIKAVVLSHLICSRVYASCACVWEVHSSAGPWTNNTPQTPGLIRKPGDADSSRTRIKNSPSFTGHTSLGVLVLGLITFPIYFTCIGPFFHHTSLSSMCVLRLENEQKLDLDRLKKEKKPNKMRRNGLIRLVSSKVHDVLH